jgi:hypothetical protein
VETEAALAAVKDEAKVMLEKKTEELVAATQAAAEAEEVMSAAEAEIERLKRALESSEAEGTSSSKGLTTEVEQLRASLSKASETHRSQRETAQAEHKKALEAADATLVEWQAASSAKRDQLASKLQTSEDSLKVGPDSTGLPCHPPHC